MTYDMMYLLTAIGLSPGGSSAVHIYTQTIHRTTNMFWLIQLIEDGSLVEAFCKYNNKCLNPVNGWYISDRLSVLPAF